MRAKPTSRWRIDDAVDGIRITIPARRRWSLLLFTGAWLLMWAAAEGSVIPQLGGGELREPRFESFGLIAWTVGGLAALGSLLWQIAGAVLIEARQGRFRQ